MLVKKFFKIYAIGIYFCSSHHVEYDGKNRIKSRHGMSGINYFKFFEYIFNMLRSYLLISVLVHVFRCWEREHEYSHALPITYVPPLVWKKKKGMLQSASDSVTNRKRQASRRTLVVGSHTGRSRRWVAQCCSQLPTVLHFSCFSYTIVPKNSLTNLSANHPIT
jgi:hypothetical protein